MKSGDKGSIHLAYWFILGIILTVVGMIGMIIAYLTGREWISVSFGVVFFIGTIIGSYSLKKGADIQAGRR